MRKLFLIVILFFMVVGLRPPLAGDAFNFSDLPPLPPPLLDEGPNPPPLTPPQAGSLSPLAQPSTMPPALPPASPAVSAPAIVQPSLPPAVPPLNPPQSAIPDVTPVNMPDALRPPEQPVAVIPSIPETPRPGKVVGGRVNVRAGPNTQYESIAVLTTGSPVTVLAKNGEWYKIVFPAEQLASIHKNYVDAELSGEIPETGVAGVINQDGTDVHAFYWDKSTVVGTLNKGDQVIIRQERGQWYRIVAPATARAYIFAEYVRVDAGGEVAADSAPPPINPSIDLSQGQPDATGRLKLSENDRRAAALKEAYFRRIQDQFARDEESQNLVAERIFDSLGELEARIKAIDEEVASRISYPMAATDLGSAAWAPPDPLSGGYTGWVENIGRVGGAPASFRLSKGGEIRFYLRSDRFSLADFAGRRVWVNGNIEPSPSGNILNVDQIRILSDQEIAEGLRQYSGVQYPLAAGSGEYADPRLSASVIPQYQPLPVIPSDPSMLPDVVESTGQSYQFAPELRGGEGGVIIDSQGEVKTDYYEAPNISDIGPE